MCKVLQLPRSNYYYEAKERASEDDITSLIITIFQESRQNYGTRKIKVELKKQGHVVSRRRIGRIMNEQGLVSSYTVAQFKPHSKSCNESNQKNELNREFDQEEELTVVVSDLTYVRVDGKWHYVCVFVDLYNREIIGYSTGPNKDAALVYRAFASIQRDIRKIKVFHTDRGKEFDNKLIEEALDTFKIQRSLSMKGCPYDNAVAEATFKIIKTEFIKGQHFSSFFRALAGIDVKIGDYVSSTDADGNFLISDIPTGKYPYVISTGETVYDEGIIHVKNGKVESLNFDISVTADEAAKNMGFGNEEDFSGVLTQSHTHGGAPHCNKSVSGPAFQLNNSDCGWALFIKYWGNCWTEAMQNTDASSETNVYCNGSIKLLYLLMEQKAILDSSMVMEFLVLILVVIVNSAIITNA